MSGPLEGRVAIVTGAGRGLGRAHALYLAGQGAEVLVNDLGGDVHGHGADATPAQRVVAEIVGRGGRAAVSGHDVSDWEQARQMVAQCVARFGRLDALVNNAGILRDRTLANMSESEWDAVIRVHLKGHAAPTAHALAHWRDRAKAGQEVKASVIHTTSVAAFAGSLGQANYSAAKAAVLALSRVVSLEAGRYGVRSNAVSPSARTRITTGIEDGGPAPEGFDEMDPANVSPLIGWLAERDCPADSQIFHISGGRIIVLSMPPIVRELKTEGRWTREALARELPGRLITPASLETYLGRPPIFTGRR
jgi:NAD(P)-dependent dehydrogenase (short-subunit alcohol dehydrogenase family)